MGHCSRFHEYLPFRTLYAGHNGDRRHSSRCGSLDPRRPPAFLSGAFGRTCACAETAPSRASSRVHGRLVLVCHGGNHNDCPRLEEALVRPCFSLYISPFLLFYLPYVLGHLFCVSSFLLSPFFLHPSFLPCPFLSCVSLTFSLLLFFLIELFAFSLTSG